MRIRSLTSDCHEPVKVRQVYNVVTNNIESPRHSPQQFLGHPKSENHNMVVFWKVLLKSLIPQFPTALMVSFRNVNCTMRQFCIKRNNETTNIKKSVGTYQSSVYPLEHKELANIFNKVHSFLIHKSFQSWWKDLCFLSVQYLQETKKYNVKIENQNMHNTGALP